MDDAQVGRGGMVEELRDLLEGERVGVVTAVRMRVGALGGEAREPGGRLVGQGIFALDGDGLEAAVDPAELDAAVGAAGLVAGVPTRARVVPAVGAEEHHVEDRLERPVEKDVERQVPHAREGTLDVAPIAARPPPALDWRPVSTADRRSTPVP